MAPGVCSRVEDDRLGISMRNCHCEKNHCEYHCPETVMNYGSMVYDPRYEYYREIAKL